uniref:Neur_chan_LBD domain-containing protein n=1 Tax=Steinernema glaseri TaxID=37863 RepID=A0A1I8AAS0_9BILA
MCFAEAKQGQEGDRHLSAPRSALKSLTKFIVIRERRFGGHLKGYWQDEFLRWNPENYEGASEIFLASEEIWIPEFSLYYSHNFNDAVKLLSNNDVRVNYTGHVRYYLPFSTESLCKLDVKFFPFDIQQCTLLFGSWAHSNDSIKYSLYTKNLSLIDFYDNQEWQLDLTHSHIMSDGFLYDYLDPPLFWEMVIMDLVVVRQSFYYVFNLVIPSTIITLVAVIGFHTPSTSGRVRDAKFRLGIMTLMSMSVILLAIVEDMPKFSMSSRRGRGSFSGIPLIGLYYFILLAIIGLSTVTTSMFVFLERDVRIKHQIPWYLRWLAFDISKSRITRTLSYHRPRRDRLPSTETLPSPRQNLRKRLSIAQYDNMIVYQYFNQLLEDLTGSIVKIEKSVHGIRQELVSLIPQDDLNSKWQTVIRRLEIISLIFYVSLIFLTMFLFFYHDWYCAIGHNPCVSNLKCPWMPVNPSDPSCTA